MTELEVEHKDLADQHAELLERMEVNAVPFFKLKKIPLKSIFYSYL